MSDTDSGAGGDAVSLDVPTVSRLLRESYKQSGRTVAELSADTGLAQPTIHIAMKGFRYKAGVPRVVEPPDRTVVKLATVLSVTPHQLRRAGRGRAAELLEAALQETEPAASTLGDLGAAREAAVRQEAAAAARELVLRKVLVAFTDDEIAAELRRRRRSSEG